MQAVNEAEQNTLQAKTYNIGAAKGQKHMLGHVSQNLPGWAPPVAPGGAPPLGPGAAQPWALEMAFPWALEWPYKYLTTMRSTYHGASTIRQQLLESAAQ